MEKEGKKIKRMCKEEKASQPESPEFFSVSIY
jgi:hypothetical protein